MSLRTCRVSCKDLDGVEHSVEVLAESLYEAVARGLRAFHASPWVGAIGEGLTIITVEIREPAALQAAIQAVTHHVYMENFRQWFDTRGVSPAQMTAKDRVRETLGGTVEPTDRQKQRRWAEERNRLKNGKISARRNSGGLEF